MEASRDAFAMLYQAHHARHSQDLPFWQALAADCRGPILELGCGSGRVLLPLAAAGHAIAGLDLDAAMLRFLRSQAPLGLKPRVLQADMTRFHLGEKFGLILLPCNTYSTLNAAQRQAALGCIRAHLQPGGQFVASIPNPRLFRRLPARAAPEVEDSFAHPLDGEPVQVSSAWQRTGQEFIVTWHYDHLLPDGRVERLSAEARHQRVAPQVYQEEMAQAGLEVQALYGDFDRAEYTATAESLIMVAGKGAAC